MMQRWNIYVCSMLAAGMLATPALAQPSDNNGGYSIGQFGLNTQGQFAETNMYAVALNRGYDTRVYSSYDQTLTDYRNQFQSAGMTFGGNQGFGINPTFSRNPIIMERWQAAGGQGTMAPLVGRFASADEARAVAADISARGLGDATVIEVPLNTRQIPGSENLFEVRMPGGIVAADGEDRQDVYVWDRQRALTDADGTTYLGSEFNTAEAPFPLEILGYDPKNESLIVSDQGNFMSRALKPVDPSAPTAADFENIEATPPTTAPTSSGPSNSMPDRVAPTSNPMAEPVEKAPTPNVGLKTLQPGQSIGIDPQVEADLRAIFMGVDKDNLRVTAVNDQGRAYVWEEAANDQGRLTAFTLRKTALGWTREEVPAWVRDGVPRTAFQPILPEVVVVPESVEVTRVAE